MLRCIRAWPTLQASKLNCYKQRNSHLQPGSSLAQSSSHLPRTRLGLRALASSARPVPTQHGNPPFAAAPGTMPPTNRVADPEDAEAMRQATCPQLSLLPVRYHKTIHFVRHGQGFHNVAGHINHDNYKLWDYADSHLTELGWTQAERLGCHVRSVGLPVELVVVAPLQRAMETAVAAFGPPPPTANGSNGHGSNGNGTAAGGGPLLMAAQDGLEGKRVARAAVAAAGCPRFVAHELCREHIGVHPCDRRSGVSTYRQRFPAIDFSLVHPDEDVLWTAEHRETKEEIRRRGLAFLQWLAGRPERHIAVVTHSSFLHFTMSCFGHAAPEAVQGELHRWYDNCEMRSLVLQDMGAPGAGAGADEGVEVGAPGAKGGDEELGAGGVVRQDPWHFPGGLHSVEEANGV